MMIVSHICTYIHVYIYMSKHIFQNVLISSQTLRRKTENEIKLTSDFNLMINIMIISLY